MAATKRTEALPSEVAAREEDKGQQVQAELGEGFNLI